MKISRLRLPRLVHWRNDVPADEFKVTGQSHHSFLCVENSRHYAHVRCETEKWRDVNQGNDINLHNYLHFFWVVAEIVAFDVIIENQLEISSIFCKKEKCCLERIGAKQGRNGGATACTNTLPLLRNTLPSHNLQFSAIITIQIHIIKPTTKPSFTALTSSIFNLTIHTIHHG